MGKKGNAFDPALLCMALRVSCVGGKLYFMCLLKKFFMHSERKVCGIILLELIVTLTSWMLGTIERNIHGRSCHTRNSNALNVTKATREEGIVAFHLHYHHYCQHISKIENKVCTQRKNLRSSDIKSRDTNFKLEKLLHKWPLK